MTICTLKLSVDSKLMQIQVHQLVALLEQLPKRRARHFGRKAYRLLLGGGICQVRSQKRSLATVAGDLAVQIRIGGMDELIAAAMRARKSNFCHG